MSYLPADDGRILQDVLRRKEFYALKNTHRHTPEDDVIPLFMVDDELKRGHHLQFHSYQLFTQNLVSVNTPYTRLLMKHSTGSGKTLGAIGIAMNFIKYYRQEELSGTDPSRIGSVYVVAFEGARNAFYKDLLRFPQFGFASRKELATWGKLKTQALSNIQSDVDRAHDYGSRIKKRVTSRRGNGFFKFVGYKALVNRLFISEAPISHLSEDEIRAKLKSGDITYNTAALDGFKNSLVICDEIHNVYNSLQKNNWGVAIQIILDHHESTRAVFMSATPINNSPSEIVDLMNLLLPAAQRIRKADFFDKKALKPSALAKLKALSTGRVSYLIDKNPVFFPARSFLGAPMPGVKYLKFKRTPFGEKHAAAYKAAYNVETQTLAQDSRYVLDFVLPDPEGGPGLYKSSDIKKIALADPKWKLDNNIDVVDGVVTGEILGISSLGSVSAKYHRVLTDILAAIKNRQGKIMVYHQYVIMSGVLFIREILLRNGILDEFMGSADNTVCAVCGDPRKMHGDDHAFMPARFVIVHGELDKATAEKSIDKFNRASNSMGDHFKILIGSRMIKESYDLKAIRHLMILSKPDNIPTLIQIMGRAVRNNSHAALPPDLRQVFVSIYTSSVPGGGLSYEEEKYKEKVEDYRVIQSIEKIFHENALDAIVNRAIVETGLEHNDLGDLDFVPTIPAREFALRDLNLSTFNAYHAQGEVDLAVYIIKRAFLETSTVWEYVDLLAYVKAPSFNVEYDTTLIADSSVIIALSGLLWTQDAEVLNPHIEDRDTRIDVVDKLFDTADKRFILLDGSAGAITQIGKYYMLMPLDGNRINARVDLPYRVYEPHAHTNINVAAYLGAATTKFNYRSKKENFKIKYEGQPIEKLSDAVCDYGVDFHVRFIEECIQYIFNSWVDWDTDKSEFHDFYFKMLYYYDIIGLVIFAHTTKEFIFKDYEKYVLPNTFVEKRQAAIEKNAAKRGQVSEERDKQNLLNLIARNISKSSCDWCPQVTKDLYERSLGKSLERFAIIKKTKSKSIVKVQADILPVGHFLQRYPKFYHPDRGWYSSPEYIVDRARWVENPIIIGYHVKSKTGIHVRFKLRRPVQDIKIHDDARLIEKGSICSTRSKTFLLDLSKKLSLTVDPKASITTVCNEVKSRLMYLELIERSRGTNIKFFYSHFENPGDA